MDPRDLGAVGRLLGGVLLLVAVALLLPLAWALAAAEPSGPFAVAALFGGVSGGGLLWTLRGAPRGLTHRGAFLGVTGSWLGACILGAVPFVVHPDLSLGLVDSLFESVSGFTTTGATVLSGLDALPRSLLLWRSVSQWVGGMGMVLLGLAVLPILGVGGMQLYKAEAPGPTSDKITPRLAETAKVLGILYVGLTVAQTVLLVLGGMSFFDSVCHAMTTISTGGFSTHDSSLAYYESGYVHGVVTVFMLLGGMSFAILYRLIITGLEWTAAPELRFYLAVFAGATLLLAIDLRTGMPDEFSSAGEAVRHGAFQAATILTTTGHVSQDYDAWPALSRSVLFALFFLGGMAGSTAGGIKVVRAMLIAKAAFAQFFRLVHPRGVYALKLGDDRVADEIVQGVAGFVALWLLLLIVGTVLLAAHGMDLLTSLSASAVSLGNIGPGLGGVGPSNTYAEFAPTAKLILAALMVIGRLEVYTVLVILTPRFWKR
jgi:trk system potassium uptake protein TrkH